MHVDATKDIVGFPGYRIGDDGSVWSAWKHNGHAPRVLSDSWKKLKSCPDHDGYLCVTLHRAGNQYRRKIHLLVLVHFVGERPPGMEACHNNGIVSDCSLSNLRWDTKASNQADRLKHGTSSRGGRNGNVKINESTAREIKKLLPALSQEQIAMRFGISRSAVRDMKSGKLWGWL